MTSEVLNTFTFLGWLTAHNGLRGVAERPQVWKLSLRRAAACPRSHHAPLKPRFKGKSVHFHLAFHPSGLILFMDDPPHLIPQICSCLETISEATDMKEAMEIMPETLEYGIINSHVLAFLRDVISQVNMDGKKNLGTFYE